MDGWKSWISSKTLWVCLIGLLVNVASMFGYTVGAEDQAAISDHIAQIGNSFGFLAAAFGRIVASKKLGGKIEPDRKTGLPR